MTDAPAKHRVRSAILPVLVSAAILIPNVVVIALGVEDFPFTTAPMFAHYVGPDSRLYAFRIEGVKDGVSEPLPIEETNLYELEVDRRLASWYYRPMTDTAPFRDLSGRDEDPVFFEATMAEFFAPIVDFLSEKRGIEYDSVELHIDVVDTSGALMETSLVGRYDPSARTYEQIYEVTE